MRAALRLRGGRRGPRDHVFKDPCVQRPDHPLATPVTVSGRRDRPRQPSTRSTGRPWPGTIFEILVTFIHTDSHRTASHQSRSFLYVPGNPLGPQVSMQRPGSEAEVLQSELPAVRGQRRSTPFCSATARLERPAASTRGEGPPGAQHLPRLDAKVRRRSFRLRGHCQQSKTQRRPPPLPPRNVRKPRTRRPC